MASFETFKLSELRLDEDNYHTGHVDGQRGAIHAIINPFIPSAHVVDDLGGVSSEAYLGRSSHWT